MSRKTKWILLIVSFFLLLSLGVNAAQAGDKENLVGRWDHETIDQSYIRFNADGTFKWVALFNTTEGKYRILSGGVIELDTPGVIYGRNQTEIKFRLTSDTLEIKMWGEWAKFKQVK